MMRRTLHLAQPGMYYLLFLPSFNSDSTPRHRIHLGWTPRRRNLYQFDSLSLVYTSIVYPSLSYILLVDAVSLVRKPHSLPRHPNGLLLALRRRVRRPRIQSLRVVPSSFASRSAVTTSPVRQCLLHLSPRRVRDQHHVLLVARHPRQFRTLLPLRRGR